jgi:competence protein ComFB
MEFHNTSEDTVVAAVQSIFDTIQKDGNQEGFCLCYQCRMDTICYVLNRIEPHYVVSNRGFARMEQDINHHQNEADIASLIYKGIRLVNHNQRPTAPHDGTPTQTPKVNKPIFEIPPISGRIFNGISFEPIVGVDLALYCEGELVSMRNNNWQNPYTMVPSTPGVFNFWPAPVDAETTDVSKVFKYTVKVDSPDYEPLSHYFSITAVSKFHTPHSYTQNRTFKLPDLYLFPPGEAEQNG